MLGVRLPAGEYRERPWGRPRCVAHGGRVRNDSRRRRVTAPASVPLMTARPVHPGRVNGS